MTLSHAARLYIRDDSGYLWTLDGERVKCVGDTTPDGGYYADSWEDAVRLLNEYKYITASKGELDEPLRRARQKETSER